MIETTADKDLAFLVENIVPKHEQMLLLRPALENALLKLGHAQESIDAALDVLLARTLH